MAQSCDPAITLIEMLGSAQLSGQLTLRVRIAARCTNVWSREAAAQRQTDSRRSAKGRFHPLALFPYRAEPRGIEKGAMANGPLGGLFWRCLCRLADIPRVRRAERSEGRCGLPRCLFRFWGLSWQLQPDHSLEFARVLPHCFHGGLNAKGLPIGRHLSV